MNTRRFTGRSLTLALVSLGWAMPASAQRGGGVGAATAGSGAGQPPTQQGAPAAPLPVINKDTMPVLVLPLVIHLGASKALSSPEQFRGILSEMQRIYDQAKIELRPTFVADTLATDSLDLYFQPSVSTSPGTNGITYGRNPRECFVRDTVRLRRVADERPEKIAVPAYARGKATASSDSMPTSQYDANQARTATHEMGHALGLPHRQDTTNLEASGTTGWTINSAEILIVRQRATQKFMAKQKGT